jgi:hypothetical protein
VLADFLAEAMRHFKQLRDVAKLPVNGDSYRRGYRSGPRMQVLFDVFHSTPLPTALWVDAVISAYTNANTLEQIIDDFKAYRALSKKGDKSMDDLLGLLEKKDILRAFEMSLKDSAKFSQDNGLYEPGVPNAGYNRKSCSRE